MMSYTRVVCHVPGCGYKSRNTYAEDDTHQQTLAHNLATTHAREKHGVYNAIMKGTDGKLLRPLRRPVMVERAT